MAALIFRRPYSRHAPAARLWADYPIDNFQQDLSQEQPLRSSAQQDQVSPLGIMLTVFYERQGSTL